MDAAKRVPEADPRNPIIQRIEREFLARMHAAGLLTRKMGIEELFRDCEVLRAITGEFLCENLILRSLPDMVVCSPTGRIYLVEIKVVMPNRDNVAVELWQLLYFRRIGGGVWYFWGWLDETKGILQGRLAQAKDIRPQQVIIPSRVASWPEETKALLDTWLRDEKWEAKVKKVDQTRGSNDPYVLFPQLDLANMVSLDEWIRWCGSDGVHKRY